MLVQSGLVKPNAANCQVWPLLTIVGSNVECSDEHKHRDLSDAYEKKRPSSQTATPSYLLNQPKMHIKCQCFSFSFFSSQRIPPKVQKSDAFRHLLFYKKFPGQPFSEMYCRLEVVQHIKNRRSDKCKIDLSSPQDCTLSQGNDECAVFVNNSGSGLYVCFDPKNSPFEACGFYVPSNEKRKSGKIKDETKPRSSFEYFVSKDNCV
jgi:hypothetical protein